MNPAVLAASTCLALVSLGACKGAPAPTGERVVAVERPVSDAGADPQPEDARKLAEDILRHRAFAWNPRAETATWVESFTFEGMGTFEVHRGRPGGDGITVEQFSEFEDAQEHLARTLKRQPVVAARSVGGFASDETDVRAGRMTLTVAHRSEDHVVVTAPRRADPLLDLAGEGHFTPEVAGALWAEGVPFVGLHVKLHPVPPEDVLIHEVRFVPYAPPVESE